MAALVGGTRGVTSWVVAPMAQVVVTHVGGGTGWCHCTGLAGTDGTLCPWQPAWVVPRAVPAGGYRSSLLATKEPSQPTSLFSLQMSIMTESINVTLVSDKPHLMTPAQLVVPL